MLYIQLVGGGIGARITSVLARVIMDVWMDRMSVVLEENNIKVYMMRKNVDDINLVTELIKKGYQKARKAALIGKETFKS